MAKPKAKLSHPRDQFAQLSAYEKARAVAALRKIKSGEISVPLTCGWCQSSSVALTENLYEGSRETVYHCYACAKDTTLRTAHKLREQRIREIILTGSDILPREFNG